MIKTLSIDLETRSTCNLKKTGVYRYSEDPSFRILLFGVSINGAPPIVYDIASGDTLPDDLLQALVSNDVIKWAFNASFERVCISSWLRKNYPDIFRGYGDPNDNLQNYLDPSSWRCSLVLCAYNGLPLSLDMAGSVLGFDKQKLKEGHELIKYFCSPCRPTKSNGGRTWNNPSDAPDKWALFKKYNLRDVEVEMQIHERLESYMVPDSVWNQYFIDQAINDRGITIDKQLVSNAIAFDSKAKDELMIAMQNLTGLNNPNSVTQLKGWLEDKGIFIDPLGKKEVAAVIPEVPEDIGNDLSLRLQSAKSSVKKYLAMENSVCDDGRCHGMFFFYGANRSGRWAGRLIQLQNLPQNHMPDLDEARDLVKQGDYEMLSLLYDNIPNVLSELIRTAFIPKPGYKFVVSDFSAIEARVLSHLAGERWRSEVFETGGDIYCASASKMFGVPVVKHGINGHLRQKGKIAELALGYGGAVGALRAMGALDMGLKEDELQPLVNSWRASNPHIVEYWLAVDDAVKTAIKHHIPTCVGDLQFYWKSNMLFIRLPSGRRLSYVQPRISVNQFGAESVTYMGMDSQKKWSRIESYGPKFVENITQAISRDVLCNAMSNLKDLFICGHVHDELIIEVPEDTDLQQICDVMGQTPSWLPGIVLRADGYECMFYQKD